MHIVNDSNESTIVQLAREGLARRIKNEFTARQRVQRAQNRLAELERLNNELVQMIGNPFEQA